MGKDTAISWTHHTFNPWWGCEKVSPACAHCYAETFAERFPASRGLWGKNSTRRFQSDKYWNAPLKWDRDAAAAGERRRVFCASMADVFEDRADLVPHRARLFDLIRRTPNLDWLLLTKRPENVWRQIGSRAFYNAVHSNCRQWINDWFVYRNPPANIWLGTTVENQEMADKRIPELLKIPAMVRFLSCEPLLGPVSLSAWLDDHNGIPRDCPLDWVICGGESGTHARPMDPDWARSLRDQCAAVGVPFHFKQWGEWCPGNYGTNIPDCLTPAQRDDKRYFHYFDPPGGKTWRVGTARAGRLLNGVLHDAFPNV